MEKHCASCHKVDEAGMMGRISFMRKSPEGWQHSLKRMLRHHDLKMEADEARKIISYLSDHHGLARGEAEKALYYSERRVHWSEAKQDEDLRKTCAACHTLGRVMAQRRDAQEWKLLKATHIAFFPLSKWQAFGERRGSRFGRSRRGSTTPEKKGSRADRVLAKLSKDQPLFTEEWKEWEIDEREVPMAGRWTGVGHEVSRGDVRGSLRVVRTAKDRYETTWDLHYGDGRRVQRTGKAVVYAGYSWRGRSRPVPGSPEGEPPQLREVLLLGADWNTLKGRLFTGDHDELGMDLSLYRHVGQPRIFSADDAAVPSATKRHVLTLHGEAFPEDLIPADFHLGRGIDVLAVDRFSSELLRLTIRTRSDVKLGRRRISLRSWRGAELICVYDTIDYIKVAPGEGFARVGGVRLPKQLERFEALAMNRGPDGKLYTKDDWPIRRVEASWKLEEFPVWEGDDDVDFVGTIDHESGVFTPNIEGPNPKRKWSANNIGDVYVHASATLDLRERLPEPKKAPTTQPHSRNSKRKKAPRLGPWTKKHFEARGHLLVAVPLYVRWDRYGWDQR